MGTVWSKQFPSPLSGSKSGTAENEKFAFPTDDGGIDVTLPDYEKVRVVSAQLNNSKAAAAVISTSFTAGMTYRGQDDDGSFANFSNLIDKVRAERRIETLVVFNSYATDRACLSDGTLKSLESAGITVILLSATSNCHLQGADVNSELLIVRCLSGPIQPRLLDNMINCLGVVRDVRILFMWHDNYAQQTVSRRNELQQQLRELFLYCARAKLLNVISVYNDFGNEKYYHTYSYFPSFHLVHNTLQETCFPNRLRDMHGAAIHTLPDQNEPRSIVWRDRLGRTQIGGYMARLVEALAKHHNATLSYPRAIVPDVTYEYDEIFKMLQNETIDLLMGVTGMGWRLNASQVSTSVLSSFWAPMLPVPPLRPTRDIYVLIFVSAIGVIFLLLLLTFSCLLTWEQLCARHQSSFREVSCTLTSVTHRSLLGQPTHVRISCTFIRRFICMLLFMTGIYMSTTSSSYLNTYLTSSPKRQRVLTFDELLRHPTRIKISPGEYKGLKIFVSEAFLEKYKGVFLVTSSVNDYYQQRKSLDTSFGYTITNSLWQALVEYQTKLGRHLFYISEGMHLAANLQLGVPLSPHSIYRSALNVLIQNSISAGLMKHWENLVYSDMVAAGKLNLTVATRPILAKGLTLDDLYWIWWLYGVGLMLALVVFLLECYVGRVAKSRKQI
ncbi:uncharacterized protein LOC101459693 [Ceratitis capitata]|uniref:uncharacterized protein LOC101459693 n=1 Tax=Ceratitis capitata TaxID=7213 RepID=UPI000329B802|nr:uncharacterized protein LOC101459693 [Ceratitis capitata]